MPCMMVQTRYVFERVDLSGKASFPLRCKLTSLQLRNHVSIFSLHIVVLTGLRPPMPRSLASINVLRLSKAHASNHCNTTAVYGPIMQSLMMVCRPYSH